jgi:hypothetical protein
VNWWDAFGLRHPERTTAAAERLGCRGSILVAPNGRGPLRPQHVSGLDERQRSSASGYELP